MFYAETAVFQSYLGVNPSEKNTGHKYIMTHTCTLTLKVIERIVNINIFHLD